MREIVLWAKAGKQNINHIADIQETIENGCGQFPLLSLSDNFNVYIDFRLWCPLAVWTNDALIHYISSDLCQGKAEMPATVVKQMHALSDRLIAPMMS